MMNFKTRVVRDGLRWRVECFRGALGWQRHPFAFSTRSEALKAQLWVAQA